ncbi:MAG TPA: TetR/AcrR family transcriptional regulator [Vulgatibacter sp.]|nr:TetR/AcrR family transcriptional regulator [Vulgatibacter sp.]
MARPSRKSEGRLEILEAAARVIAKNGFHGMSMRELARQLGKTPAVFYNYYRSKEDLLLDLQVRAFEALVQSARDAIARAGEPTEKLYAFIVQHLQYVGSHRAVMQVLVQEANSLPAAQRKTVRAIKEEYYAVGRDVIRDVLWQSACVPGNREKRATLARAVDELELERQTYAVFGMLNWTYGWYRPKDHGAPEELAHTLHRMLLCGLRPDCPLHVSKVDLRELDDRLRERKRIPLLRTV